MLRIVRVGAGNLVHAVHLVQMMMIIVQWNVLLFVGYRRFYLDLR